MSREATAAKRTCPHAATASYTVQFQKRSGHRTQRHQEPTAGRVPRVTHLLALAHKIDGMIRAGEIKDLAETARLLGVTRARITQIVNLTLLAPGIQESILFLGDDDAKRMQRFERDLRIVLSEADWRKQVKLPPRADPR